MSLRVMGIDNPVVKVLVVETTDYRKIIIALSTEISHGFY